MASSKATEWVADCLPDFTEDEADRVISLLDRFAADAVRKEREAFADWLHERKAENPDVHWFLERIRNYWLLETRSAAEITSTANAMREKARREDETDVQG